MKTIEFEILELSDIKRTIKNSIDKVLFLFKRPKYKIGMIVATGNWSKNKIISAIKKDYKTCTFHYKFTGSGKLDYIWFSEGLLDFYNPK